MVFKPFNRAWGEGSSNIGTDRAPFIGGGAGERRGAHHYVCKMTSHNLHMRGRTEDEFLLVNRDPLKNHRKKPQEKTTGKTPQHVRYNRGINVALL